jgi:hypothetical protein
VSCAAARKPSIQNQKFTNFANKLVDIISNATQSILNQRTPDLERSFFFTIGGLILCVCVCVCVCTVKMKHKGLVSSLLLFDEGQQPVTSGAPLPPLLLLAGALSASRHCVCRVVCARVG